MAIGDYIPNVFGANPTMYQGLLGADEAANLTRQSNIAGLLGAAATLATGMGSQGPRRSALQNVLGALAAGYGTAGQAYGAGIEQMANAQKLAQTKLQMQQNVQAQQAINNMLADPAIANDPAAVAYIRSNPADAIKEYAQINAFKRQREQFMPKAPAAQPTAPTADGQLAPVTVTGRSEIADLERQIQESLADASAFRAIRKPTEAEASVRMAERLRERQQQLMASDIDIQGRIDSAPEQFKGQYQALAQIKDSLKPNEFVSALQKVDQAVLESGKQYKYDGIVGQYAYNAFGTNDATKLTPEQNRNILAFANAPNQADILSNTIAAKRLQAERGVSVPLPTSREAMLGGVQPAQPTAAQPTAQPVAQPAQAPTIVPRGPIPPMAQPPAPQVAPEMQRTGEVQQQPVRQQKPLVDLGKTIPLVKQPDIKVPLATKQKLLEQQGGATAATSYALTNIKDARDVAKQLLDNKAYIKALSGPFAPKLTELPIGDAYDAKQILDNLLGRSFVNEIAEMRANSPTGGAVGNVAVAEMEALSKIRGALKVGMSEKELKNQLQTYINNADRALKGIPKRYAEIYGYDGQFDDVLSGTVIPSGPQTDPVLKELQRRKDAEKQRKKP